MIQLNIQSKDAETLVKCLKLARARKQLEANQHIRKHQLEWAEKKYEFVKQIDQLDQYIGYFIK